MFNWFNFQHTFSVLCVEPENNTSECESFKSGNLKLAFTHIYIHVSLEVAASHNSKRVLNRVQVPQEMLSHNF